MDTKLREFLQPLIVKRSWSQIQEKLHPRVYSTYKNQNIYQFYSTLTDSLEKNPSSIAVWVHAIDSYAPLHVHNYVELTIPLIGECTMQTKAGTVLVKEGDVFIAGNHMVHTVQPVPQDSLVICIGLKESAFTLNDYNNLFNTQKAESIYSMLFSSLNHEDYSGTNYMLFKTKNEPKIAENIEDIIWEYYHPNSQTNQIIHHELLILFARLIRLVSENEFGLGAKNEASTNLLSLLLYIEKNFNSLTLENMAKEFGFNKNYLTAYLKKHTGLTFIQLVHLQRINIAAEYLTHTNAPIEKIAEKIGYENPSYFYKVFRKYLQLSPKEYRIKSRNNQQNEAVV